MKVYGWGPDDGTEEEDGCTAVDENGLPMVNVFKGGDPEHPWEVSVRLGSIAVHALANTCQEGKAIADKWLKSKGYKKAE